MKKILVLIILVVVGFGGYYLYQKSKNPNYQIYVPKDKTVEDDMVAPLNKPWERFEGKRLQTTDATTGG